MKKIAAAFLAITLTLSLAACSEVIVPTDDEPATSPSSSASGFWTGSYSGDGMEITLKDNGDGTVDATIDDGTQQTITLTVSGSTATSELRVDPEMQGGDMGMDAAKERFPDIFYTYTLTQNGDGISYTCTMELHRIGETDAQGNPFPTQIETFSVELSRNTESIK